MHNGIPFQTGPGTLVRHLPGQVIYSSERPVVSVNDIITDLGGVTYNPYLMGETAYGSTNPNAPTTPPASTDAQTDTWDITKPPLDILNNATFGVGDVKPTRIVAVPAENFYFYASDTSGGAADNQVNCSMYRVFERALQFNSNGALVAVSAETLIGNLAGISFIP